MRIYIFKLSHLMQRNVNYILFSLLYMKINKIAIAIKHTNYSVSS